MRNYCRSKACPQGLYGRLKTPKKATEDRLRFPDLPLMLTLKAPSPKRWGFLLTTEERWQYKSGASQNLENNARYRLACQAEVLEVERRTSDKGINGPKLTQFGALA